jgi:mitogen-activated protein kinase 1/3
LQHDPEDEPTVARVDTDYFNFDDHKEDLTKADLKELLYEEILSFVPSI